MSNASRDPKRVGKAAAVENKADADTSGERPAMPHSGYAGLMSLGSEAFSAPLPPPQSEHPRISARMRIGLYLLGSALGISLGAVGVAFVLTRPPAPEPETEHRVAVAARKVAAMPEATASLKEIVKEAPAPIAAEPSMAPSMPEPSDEVAPPAAAATPAPASEAAPAAAAVPAAQEQQPVERAASAPSRSRSDSGSRPRRQKENAPQHLSRDQVISAMSRVQPAVAACFHGTRGSAMASITIIGRTGRVTTAQISGQGGAIGSCIARAVRGATFPRFADDSLTIRYPFAH
jgi:hypothetical protein